MTPEQFRRIEQVFDAVADAAPGERAGLLDRLCGDDRALRAEVESLLAAATNAGAQIEGAIRREAGLVTEGEAPRRIANRYTVLEKLGVGGMGEVYRARDRLTGQLVALKRVHVVAAARGDAATVAAPSAGKSAARPPRDSSPFLLSLAREFRALASMRHPHVISVLDYGFETKHEPYFTMELLSDARLLSDAMRDATRDQRIRLLLQVLQALTYVHRRGVLHRDLKPANVLVLGVGDAARVKVLDFGIASVRDQTTQIDLAGTIPYMAPELFQDQPPTAAADLWAVGIMVHEALLDTHPIRARGAVAIMNTLLGGKPIFAADERLGPDLSGVLRRALAPAPGDRHPDAWAFARHLARAAGLPAPPETAEIRDSFLAAAAFVGRREELAALRTALAEAIEGAGALWLVGGESGVGKSRLLDELRTHALVRGARVVRGQAIDAGGAAYQVWRGALRPLCLTGALDDLDAGVLRTAVPDIAALRERPAPEPPEIDAQSALTRFLRVVERVLLESGAPLVILLEDLHWADPASLALLRHLGRIVPRSPLLVIGSYRDDERPDLPAALPGARRLPVRRFSDDEIAALGASMLGDTGRHPEVIALLQRETEGNAFFAVEVMRALAQEAGTITQVGRAGVPSSVAPGGVRAVLARRLGRVPRSAGPLLRAAAVLGRELDLAVLRALSPALPGSLDADLAACVSASVLEVSEDRWRFAHDKLREALLEELSPDERAAWHLRLGEAIERAYAGDLDPHAAVLVHHFEQGGRPEREAIYRARAGERAMRGGATLEAIEHLERANRIFDRIGGTPEDRARALGLLCRAYHAAGRPDACVQIVERLFAGAGFPPPRSPLELAGNIARGAAGHARFRWRPGAPRLRGRSEEPAFVREMSELAIAISEDLGMTRSPWWMLGASLDFIAAAEHLGDPFALAPAYAALGFSLSATPLSALAHDYLARARALLAGAPGERLDVRAHLNTIEAIVHIHHGRWEAARACIDVELEQRRRMGDWRAEMLALVQGASIELHRGDMPSALAFLGTLEEAEQRMDHPSWWGLRGLQSTLALRRGALEDAARLIADADQLLATAGVRGGAALVDSPAALCALRRGDAGLARRRADAALDRLLATPPMTYPFSDATAGVAQVYAALWSAAPAGAAAAALEARMGRALSVLRNLAVMVPMARARAFLWHGRWAALRGRPRRARWHLQRALAAAERYRMPFDEALARQALADVEDARGARGTAAAHRRRARQLFEQLGATWHTAELAARGAQG